MNKIADEEYFLGRNRGGISVYASEGDYHRQRSRQRSRRRRGHDNPPAEISAPDTINASLAYDIPVAKVHPPLTEEGIKAMNKQELREQLASRDQDTQGSKRKLITRLMEWKKKPVVFFFVDGYKSDGYKSDNSVVAEPHQQERYEIPLKPDKSDNSVAAEPHQQERHESPLQPEMLVENHHRRVEEETKNNTNDTRGYEWSGSPDGTFEDEDGNTLWNLGWGGRKTRKKRGSKHKRKTHKYKKKHRRKTKRKRKRKTKRKTKHTR